MCVTPQLETARVMDQLKVLLVSVEVAPFAKVGGLADVVGSLPQALRAQGVDARVLMPAYGMTVNDPEYGAKPLLRRFPVKPNPYWTVQSHLYETENKGVPTYLLGGGDFFDHVSRSEELYSPGRDAYLFLASAMLEAFERIDWIPDVVHCNDWHTGFFPVLMRHKGGPAWDETAGIMTIHNLLYQGDFGRDTLQAVALPDGLFHMHALETFGSVNFLAAGCKMSDLVNTVSPNYAKEIQTPEYGDKLWGLMGDLASQGKLRGILNGIDTEAWDPATDPEIEGHYDANDLSGKAISKKALQQELGLPVNPDIPIVAIVSRLSNQKGFDLVVRQAYGMLGQPAQFITLAVGDPWAAGELHKLSEEWPDACRFIERFDAPLAQRIYAGSDLFLMPSNWEPCGLGQMFAMRYGTVPIARRTGGLADTVFEGENGFVFEHRSARELYEAIRRAITVYKNDKPQWEKLMRAGMTTDFGWEKSAREYTQLYKDALANRRAEARDLHVAAG